MKMKKKILSFLLAAAVVLGAVLPASLAYAQNGSAAPLQATDENENGLYVGKTATTNDDGSYTITMEAYTTGSVTSVESAVPLDIVLVLDQSGSMAYDFNGNSTSTNTARRQYAMKQAVENFIGSVAEQYNAETADHRMAIVTFGSDASTLRGWTYVDQNGAQALKGVVSDLDDRPQGATRVDAGMSTAETLMGSGYGYTGDNTNRQKVVIVFTDGVPTTSSDFSISVADDAIQSALNLKNAGVTIYSVGIFTGAEPSQLYGDTYHSIRGEQPCTGEIGSIFNTDLSTSWGDVEASDVPAGNRFLNYLSSNFATANEIGLEVHDETIWLPFVGDTGFFGYKITQTFDSTDTGYYLTASDQEGLNNVFQTISDEIGTPAIQLGAETEICDTITPYFNAPANASAVKVYTADYNGTQFGDRKETNAVQVSVEKDTVSVTGFDFNENYVTDTARDGNFYGKKLIIEFTVTPKDGFLGGNQVPTNTANSGVYYEGAAVDTFTVPTVDVPLGKINITPEDKNLYLMGSLTEAEAWKGATVTVGGVSLDMTKSNYGLEEWQNAFVDIYTSGPNYSNQTKDATYSLGMEVAPKYDGTVDYQNGSGSANIYVFKPEITWKDSQLNVGEIANYYKDNFVGVEWKHATQPYVESNMVGTAPELDYAYEPEVTSATHETEVNVTVKIGGTDVTGFVTFLHEDCGFDTCTFNPAKCEFIVHIKSFDLTIVKEGWEAIDENQTFVFTVEGPNVNMQVVIEGNGSTTIKGLPAGEYTVTEDTSWSWRYETTHPTQTVTANDIKKGEATVTFVNTRENEQWLNGSAYCKNDFSTTVR